MAARKKVTRRAGAGEVRRLRKITRALEGMIGGDLDRQLPISGAGDELDALCYSVNILVGELAFATANLRRARADAEAANAAKSSFLRAASHELRTPLAVIVWLVEAIKDPTRAPPERVERSLAGIRRSADELLRTTEAVLDLSRLDDPNARLEVEATNVIATVGEAVENLRPLAERKQLGVRLAIEDEVPAILMTNAQHFRQVVVNLVANAIKFTAQGEIVVRVLRRAGKLAIDVEDPGAGIPLAARGRIFEPFFQVDRSLSQRLGGTGVGLAIAKRFAEGLGGDVRLRASREGRGSTFRFTIPLQRPADDGDARAPAARRVSASARARPLEGLRILVADDEKLVRDALAKLLEMEGAIVGCATNGEEAVTMALAEDFSLVLMDVRMPGVDGLEATSRLRAAKFGRPILALTANASPEQRAACMAAGCSDHLAKPIAGSDLIARVAAAWRSGHGVVSTAS
jgi:signal transduction histidine kinase/CheY-like chemotaxis protein